MSLRGCVTITTLPFCWMSEFVVRTAHRDKFETIYSQPFDDIATVLEYRMVSFAVGLCPTTPTPQLRCDPPHRWEGEAELKILLQPAHFQAPRLEGLNGFRGGGHARQRRVIRHLLHQRGAAERFAV